MPEIRIPLVSYTVKDTDDGSKLLEYYVGDTQILSLNLFKESADQIFYADGSVDPLTLTKIMVTPHTHLNMIDQLLRVVGSVKLEDIPIPEEDVKTMVQDAIKLLQGN